ncbi:MAG TPA: PAS domain-containing sensor histidine kinase, partial [Acidimicrobiia bacterium]|nr:PAS domain-containing sensor histidine kinase [Acidimicrobiia bacterium]
LWIGGFTAIAAGARYEAVAPAAVHANAEAVDGNAATLLVPYLLVVPAFVLAVPRLLGDAPLDRGLVWNGVGVASLMLARQLADRLDNVRLVHSLRTTVTELRRRDDQLAEAQAISRLGSWEWDVDAGTIVRTDEAVRVFGLEPGSLHPGGDGLLPHVHPDDRDRVRRSVLRSIETGEPFRVDFRVTAVDGRIVHGRGRVVHDDSGRAVRMVGTVQDVTTVRRLARELEQRLAELERSNRDLAHFAAVASHDLAAPVQLLLGHLRLLSTRVRERGERTDAEMIEGAIRGAQRLEELIQDILAYSLASGGDESLRTRVDTARVARDAARAVGSDGWAASVEIGDMPTVDAHPGQVRQLFSNLLSNAFKFVPAGRPPRIRVWADRVDGVWRFSVADNGTGVPDRERERIFQMFQRGAGADVSGAGIGLAICARIVARHGGRIWCAPNPEGGSIFSFTLAEGATALFADDLVEVTGA